VERSPQRSRPEPGETGESKWKWRYEIPISIDDTAWVDGDDEAVGTAWMQLQLVHTSFRHLDTKEYRELSARLEEIERLFMDRVALEPYFKQAYAPEQPKPDVPTASLIFSDEVRHMVAIQAQFLEDMFYVLELDRHANAPDNRGWMNLFRRWGRSPTFNYWFDDLRSTFSLGFLEFYDLYLRDHPHRIDEKPVPHPWDAEQRREDDRGEEPTRPPTGGAPAPRGKQEPEAESQRSQTPQRRRLFPGLFLDSGIREVDDSDPTTPKTRSGQGPVGAPGGGGPEPAKGPESGTTHGPEGDGPSTGGSSGQKR